MRKSLLSIVCFIVYISCVQKVNSQTPLAQPLPQGTSYWKGMGVSQVGFGVIGCNSNQYIVADGSGCANIPPATINVQCTNQSSDTTAINAAFTAIRNSGNPGTVWLHGLTCDQTSKLVIGSNTTLKADPNTVINRTDTTNNGTMLTNYTWSNGPTISLTTCSASNESSTVTCTGGTSLTSANIGDWVEIPNGAQATEPLFSRIATVTGAYTFTIVDKILDALGVSNQTVSGWVPDNNITVENVNFAINTTGACTLYGVALRFANTVTLTGNSFVGGIGNPTCNPYAESVQGALQVTHQNETCNTTNDCFHDQAIAGHDVFFNAHCEYSDCIVADNSDNSQYNDVVGRFDDLTVYHARLDAGGVGHGVLVWGQYPFFIGSVYINDLKVDATASSAIAWSVAPGYPYSQWPNTSRVENFVLDGWTGQNMLGWYNPENIGGQASLTVRNIKVPSGTPVYPCVVCMYSPYIANISTITASGTTYTVTTASTYGTAIGSSLEIMNTSNTAINNIGSFTVTSINPSANTFTFTAASGLGNATGGTVQNIAGVANWSIDGAVIPQSMNLGVALASTENFTYQNGSISNVKYVNSISVSPWQPRVYVATYGVNGNAITIQNVEYNDQSGTYSTSPFQFSGDNNVYLNNVDVTLSNSTNAASVVAISPLTSLNFSNYRFSCQSGSGGRLVDTYGRIATISGSVPSAVSCNPAPILLESGGSVGSMAGTPSIAMAIQSNINSTQCGIEGSNPSCLFANSAGPTDEKMWDYGFDSSGNYYMRAINDANTAANTVMQVSRSGYVPQMVGLYGTGFQLPKLSSLPSSGHYCLQIDTAGTVTPTGNACLGTGGAAQMDRCSGGTSDGLYVAAGSTLATTCTSGGGTLVNTGLTTN